MTDLDLRTDPGLRPPGATRGGPARPGPADELPGVLASLVTKGLGDGEPTRAEALAVLRRGGPPHNCRAPPPVPPRPAAHLTDLKCVSHT
ncbi:hypothetical protein [Frankia sp. AgKG'84/4]|uniref:hypothetical protein n=1 Tax=Frankia sp. AgKG'84/4 TaxID=573490 RepID=UPI00202A9DAF|nr:hypothetical protein [Frankia sp. AgKG'84/4]MCL9795547.1 hypothetical protein [Frankia sp. AgKG'84/4]